MKTRLLLATFCLTLASPCAQAQSLRADDQLRTFATCAGRLSAVMEYQWMFDGPASDHTKAQRAAVLDLIAAIVPPDQTRAVLHWRIAAKAAQSALLRRATFNDDPADADWARRTSARMTRACASLLLG
ncbi:hypothetical protein [Yoonia sp.]|uniref:hypothetical protein n=1 Tax=Yoonia sp. TaxID=2212373 RepID=UPI0025DAA364|nr:hypothetical protein [Yoonia sp.]